MLFLHWLLNFFKIRNFFLERIRAGSGVGLSYRPAKLHRLTLSASLLQAWWPVPESKQCRQNTTRVDWRKDSSHIGEFIASHFWIFYQNKKPMCRMLKIRKYSSEEQIWGAPERFYMELYESHLGFPGFSRTDFYESVLIHFNFKTLFASKNTFKKGSWYRAGRQLAIWSDCLIVRVFK